MSRLRLALPRGDKIPTEYFGMHYIKGPGNYGFPANTPYVDIGQKALRGWDILATWKMIEPTKGNYSTLGLGYLDDHVGRARDLGLPMMFTLGQAPEWASGSAAGNGVLGPVPPTNDQDWADYCTFMATRNLSQWGRAIKIWEVWNEPNLADYYQGTNQRLAELIDIANTTIKAIDPLAKVYTPCPVGFTGATLLDDVLGRVSGSIDGCSMHIYPYPRQPEAGMALIQSYRSVMNRRGLSDKPLVCSETTWPSYKIGDVVYTTPMSEDMGAAYIARIMLVNWLAGARQTYFYGLDYSFSMIRLLDIDNPTVRLKPSYAYEYIAGLLSGGYLSNWQADSAFFQASFISGDGEDGSVMWCADDVTATIDTTGYSEVRDVLGQPVTKSAAYTLTSSPIYCFN